MSLLQRVSGRGTESRTSHFIFNDRIMRSRSSLERIGLAVNCSAGKSESGAGSASLKSRLKLTRVYSAALLATGPLNVTAMQCRRYHAVLIPGRRQDSSCNKLQLKKLSVQHRSAVETRVHLTRVDREQ